jgi:hypothetical protein
MYYEMSRPTFWEDGGGAGGEFQSVLKNKKTVYTIFCIRPTTCGICGHVRMSKNAMRADLSRQMKKKKSTRTHPAYRQIWDTLLACSFAFTRQLSFYAVACESVFYVVSQEAIKHIFMWYCHIARERAIATICMSYCKDASD